MKNKKKYLLFFLMIFWILPLANQEEVFASNTSGIPFVVTPIMPKNQDSDVQSYFKLHAQSGESQTLFVRIENLKSEPIVVKVESDNALTSPMGEIQYIPGEGNENAKIIDPSFQMKDHISVQTEIQLKANEKKEIPISVRAPKSTYGTYLGGVTFISELDTPAAGEEIKDSNAYYFDIENRIGFALAIQWDMPTSEEDSFSIEKAGVRIIPSGVQSYIEIQNNSASILADFSADYYIKKKDGTALFTGKISNVNFAPKTSIRYPIMWKGDELTTGDFLLEMDAKAGDQVLRKNVDFSINNSFIEQYVKETGAAVAIQKEGMSNLKIGMGIGIIGLVFVVALLFGARRKKDDPEEDNS